VKTPESAKRSKPWMPILIMLLEVVWIFERRKIAAGTTPLVADFWDGQRWRYDQSFD